MDGETRDCIRDLCTALQGEGGFTVHDAAGWLSDRMTKLDEEEKERESGR